MTRAAKLTIDHSFLIGEGPVANGHYAALVFPGGMSAQSIGRGTVDIRALG